MEQQVKSDHRRIIAKGTNANFPKLSDKPKENKNA
jgi:hypothetical protein